jgi:hypothetical protein
MTEIINDIIKKNTNDKDVNIYEYIQNNIPLFINNINDMDTPILFHILNDDNIDIQNMFLVIKNINYHTTLKLLYYSNFFSNFKLEALLLLKLLNYENIYKLCCSNNETFSFIKHDRTITAIISQLKEIYIYVYNEDIKYKCFRNKKNNNFIVIIQNNCWKFNVNVLLSNLKKLIMVLEYVYSFHNVYYQKEKDFYNLNCKNLEEHMFYEEQFNGFVEDYRINNKITDITSLNNTDESIGNIDDILKFLFIND